MQVELDGHTDNPEMKIATRGGISHDSKPEDLEDARRRIRDFVRKGHHSTLEFADATFHVDGISRSCLAQLTRHRLVSFMVKSQRYTDASEEKGIVPQSVDSAIMNNGDVQILHNKWVNRLNEFIEELKQAGVPKEDYRYFLPIGTETELYMKANFREFRHVIGIRGLNEHAQWEIRELAQRILEKLYSVAPSVYEDQYSKLGDM